MDRIRDYVGLQHDSCLDRKICFREHDEIIERVLLLGAGLGMKMGDANKLVRALLRFGLEQAEKEAEKVAEWITTP